MSKGQSASQWLRNIWFELGSFIFNIESFKNLDLGTLSNNWKISQSCVITSAWNQRTGAEFSFRQCANLHCEHPSSYLIHIVLLTVLLSWWHNLSLICWPLRFLFLILFTPPLLLFLLLLFFSSLVVLRIEFKGLTYARKALYWWAMSSAYPTLSFNADVLLPFFLQRKIKEKESGKGERRVIEDESVEQTSFSVLKLHSQCYFLYLENSVILCTE